MFYSDYFIFEMLFFTFLLFVFLIIWIIRTRRRFTRHAFSNVLKNIEGCKLVGIFHPFCNSGGGGERVLWTSVKCMLDK